jgi:hypothetical protein
VKPDEVISVRPTEDIEFITSVFRQLFDQIRTDQVTDFELVAVSIEAVPQLRDIKPIFIEVEVNGTRCGVVMYLQGELHTMFLPSLRGAQAVRAARKVLSWFWENTDDSTLRSYVYSNRPEVRLFARILGFSETQTFDDGSTINGVTVLRTDLVLSRPANARSNPSSHGRRICRCCEDAVQRTEEGPGRPASGAR